MQIFRPQKIILNSKFRKQGEDINSCTFYFQKPIKDCQGLRINNFSSIYLVALINPNQAKLDFSLSGTSTTYDYSIDLSTLSSKYYNDMSTLLEDINSILSGLFVDNVAGNQYYTGYKPTLSADVNTFQIIFQVPDNTIDITIDSNNSNFWFKLGWPNGTYDDNTYIMTSPSYGSILPLNEVYIQIENFTSSLNSLLITDDISYPNIDNIAQVFTFDDENPGDIFIKQQQTEPKFPIEAPQSISFIKVNLLDSRGNKVEWKANYKLVLELLY